ncbi:amino acid transporter [Amniculicola lignicola CBS 123094]|uniref:Amino acid transporter n=1 Tax=Amniculicola lignicola CBS 123094 TaxID=1392246 RepID=A0A6A5WVS7_9PLEO|nr:amino acid transporter [Amniculicola lignicola CBS 123094]
MESKSGLNSASPIASISEGAISSDHGEQEVFKTNVDGVEFRTLTWQRLIIILLKVQIATGVLSIPSAMGSLGAVPGALIVVGWQALNTYTACILIDFRNRHHCHNIIEMCAVMWGRVGYELVNFLFLVAFLLCTGSGLLGTSIAFNALSEHGACSVWFSFAAACLIVCYSSIRTFDRMTWPMTAAFICVMGGILTVVIGVSLRDRPAAAPVTGDFDLGFAILGHPSFAAGVTATATIFISSAAGPVYLPIIAEMKRPQDYKKAVIPVGIMVGSVYLSMSMVVYYYCGNWIATPSLGSAGPLLKKVAYGIALPSLIVSAGIFNHTSAKTTFVRLMRNSPHFQTNSWQHWATWLGLNIGFGFLAFIMAEAIPVFNYILALAGSVCFAPMSLMFPALMWMWDIGPQYKSAGLKGKAWYAFHVLILAIGAFMVVGGIYGTAMSIKETYSSAIPFSCADNSNTIV